MMLHPDGRVLAILLLACAACNRDREAPPAQQPAAPPPAIAAPAEKLDSFTIEGTQQKIALRLVHPNSSIPFLTYMPTDMVQESVASDEGEGHFFYANFGGVLNREAFLLVFVLPAGATQEDAVMLAKAFRASRERPGYIVKIDARLHKDRYYYIAQQYPNEYAEGFAPRSQRIQDEWQWLD